MKFTYVLASTFPCSREARKAWALDEMPRSNNKQIILQPDDFIIQRYLVNAKQFLHETSSSWNFYPFSFFSRKFVLFLVLLLLFFTISRREEKISTGNLISNDARTTNERTYAMRTRDRGLLNSMRDRTVASMARESHTGKYASIIA